MLPFHSPFATTLDGESQLTLRVFRVSLRAMWSRAPLAGLLLAGCVLPATAPSVPYDHKLDGSDAHGVVLGKVGFPSRSGDPMNGASIIAVDAAGKRWSIALDPALSQDGGNSAPFMVRLAPGRYRLTKLEIEYSNTTWTMEEMHLDLEVEPGRISCAGAAYIRGRAIEEQPTGDSRLGSTFQIADECPALRQVYATRAPYLPAQTAVHLFSPAR